VIIVNADAGVRQCSMILQLPFCIHICCDCCLRYCRYSSVMSWSVSNRK